MRQQDLKPAIKWQKNRKRRGRGDGSGRGNYSGRGMKGQNSRSGGGVRPGFEGGQIALIKALPSMRGFTNIFKVKYVPVNLKDLDKIGDSLEITPDVMVDSRIVKNKDVRIKILGEGSLSRPLVVHAHKFSNEARKKIEDAGGSVKELSD